MPSSSAPTERRTEKLEVRVSPATKLKLQSAAAFTHRSMSEFVVESALSRAEEMLADRRTFYLDAETWMAFQSALDTPPRSLPRMKKILEKPGFFDSGSSR
ncbi:MAG TPA: DUF1778 domain-containing protein [Terriglobia bacterium]|nr:DUF1778 domain-containing protein [Terriglobia bacterium]